MAKVITVINQKGGVGKTTTAHAVGAWLQKEKGAKVLFIDLDQQGNLTYCTGGNYTNSNALEVLITGKLGNDSIQETPSGAFVICSSPMLSNADMTLTDVGKEYRLKEALSNLKGFDYVVVDTPPSLNILTVNALTASDYVLIPAHADIFSLQGITHLGQTVDVVKKYTNKDLLVLGIILTKHNPRVVLSRDLQGVLEEIASQLGAKVYANFIREAVALKEAQALKKDIFSYDAKSNPAQDYHAVMEEIYSDIIADR